MAIVLHAHTDRCKKRKRDESDSACLTHPRLPTINTLSRDHSGPSNPTCMRTVMHVVNTSQASFVT